MAVSGGEVVVVTVRPDVVALAEHVRMQVAAVLVDMAGQLTAGDAAVFDPSEGLGRGLTDEEYGQVGYGEMSGPEVGGRFVRRPGEIEWTDGRSGIVIGLAELPDARGQFRMFMRTNADPPAGHRVIAVEVPGVALAEFTRFLAQRGITS